MCGSEQKPNFITIDNHILQVPKSLYEALLRLRDHDLGGFLWIDALCINQDNNSEKEEQIGLMARIYGSASSTIVWLGETFHGSHRAIEAIRLAGRANPGFSSSKDYRRLFTDLDRNNKFVKFESENRGAVCALLDRPWFRRIWVRNTCVRSFA